MKPSTRAWMTAALASALCVSLCSGNGFAQQTERTLSGTVTDIGREPLRGAVVEVVDTTTNNVNSYLTDRRGQFVFKRLSAGTDYQFFATYRGHKSKTKRLGKFDHKVNENVNLVIPLH